MSYGRLSELQRTALAAYVSSEVVYDLGAGDCELSVELVRLGAAGVVAIDKEPHARLSVEALADKKVHLFEAYFSDLPSSTIDVAFVSWPQNRYDAGLLRLLAKASVVIYLGKNTDGSSCGCPELFREFLRREQLAYAADRANTLIVYGGYLPRPRVPKGEEYAGLTMFDQDSMLSYEEAEADHG